LGKDKEKNDSQQEKGHFLPVTMTTLHIQTTQNQRNNKKSWRKSMSV
jgi:hypothetical protein